MEEIMLFIGAFFTGIVTAGLLAAVYHSFGDRSKVLAIAEPAGIGLLVAILYYVTGKCQEIAWVEALAAFLFIVVLLYLVYRWNQEGSMVRELLAFIVLILIIGWAGCGAAAALAKMVPIGVLAGLIEALPHAVMIEATGFIISNLLLFSAEMHEDEDDA